MSTFEFSDFRITPSRESVSPMLSADHDIEFLFICERDHLVVETSGRWRDVEQAMEMIRRIAAEAEAEGQQRVLWYFDLTDFKPTQLECYKIAEGTIPIFRNFILALVRHPPVDAAPSLRIDDIGDIAHNRGYTGRHFADSDEARRWLLSTPLYATHLWDQ
ncbi:hypothetical protein [Blastopirellula retiformator]|nr:hypothetical protein [Blastopirellula retiformator]